MPRNEKGKKRFMHEKGSIDEAATCSGNCVCARLWMGPSMVSVLMQ